MEVLKAVSYETTVKVHELRLVELENPDEVSLLRRLIDKYHEFGCIKGSGLGKGLRHFVLEADGYWVAGCIIHQAGAWAPMFIKWRLPVDNSYMVRRIAQFAPGHWAVMLLEKLAEKLRSEGKEMLVTTVIAEHSGALYKKAGFEEIGVSKRGTKILIRKLR